MAPFDCSWAFEKSNTWFGWKDSEESELSLSVDRIQQNGVCVVPSTPCCRARLWYALLERGGKSLGCWFLFLP